jgi:hypothetical protein
MNSCLLVSLISDQTIPNIQLINEYGSIATHYLFITTQGMEKKGVRDWIITSCKLKQEQILEPIFVDQFSFDDIEYKLDNFQFEKYEKIIVNLTGGTKVMTLAAFDFFKDLGAEIYYLTGSDNVLIKLAPGRKKKVETLKTQVNLEQFFQGYGFEIKETTTSSISVAYTNSFFKKFTSGMVHSFNPVLGSLREKRGSRITDLNSISGLNDFLTKIEFPLNVKGELSKYEIKYLTGEWFEEYISNKLVEELKLSSDQIKTGIVISKKNKVGAIIPNELDVVFVWKNKIYLIEGKTSVFYDSLLPDGSTKSVSIIGETLYKSDSLKQGLGLFANTSIFILDSLKEYHIKLKAHLERADLYNINIIDKEAILHCDSIRSLLKI